MMKKFLPLYFIFFPILLFAGQKKVTVNLQWQPLQSETTLGNREITWISFEKALFQPDYGSLPFYHYDLPIADDQKILCTIVPLSTDTLDVERAQRLSDGDLISDRFVKIISGSPTMAQINVMPMKKVKGKIVRLLRFKMELETVASPQKPHNIIAHKVYKKTSVLASGKWYKMGVMKSGVYQITYDDFVAMGWNPAEINPDEIKIYGNYTGVLHEANRYSRPDDLLENAILVKGGADGSFDRGDTVLFYGRAPMVWRYDPFVQRYDHHMNVYTDTTWYFLTVSAGAGKRIQTEESVQTTPTKIVNDNYEHQVHEKDLVNLISSGREWYGEELSGDTMERNFHFHFPGLQTNKAVFLRFEMVARSSVNTYYKLFVNNRLVIDSNVFHKISPETSVYAREVSRSVTFFSNSQDLNVSVRYFASEPNSVAWINYIAFNAVCNLQFTSGEMHFSDPHANAAGNICRYEMSNANPHVKIWDVSNFIKAKNIAFQINGSNLQFTVPNDTLREFVAFDDTQLHHPVAFRAVPNQNLHGINRVDFVVIAPPEFKAPAERLVQLHRDYDHLKCIVVTPEAIYNEFSSGAQDITAIRDFMRMLYDNNAFDGSPGYLLLFGDASFDYRNRLPHNTNEVPTYESAESLRETGSFVTDDYFGLLDEDEGSAAHGNLDIGIGRFPVSTLDEAKAAVDKVAHYMKNTTKVLRDWRNRICFVADDRDNNLHLNQAEQLCAIVDTAYPFLNINKIYSDAFTKVKMPSGYRFPEVNKRIDEQIENGALIINYTGHGGLIGWSDEAILDVPAIRSFTNIDNLPLFITATCEFSRFDNPKFVSAGEYTFLNQHGGAIALLTTTRLAYAHANIIVNMRIYHHLIERENGTISRFGDMIRLSKIPSSVNFLNFTLLGDPALRLAIPVNNVVTTTINSVPVAELNDSIHALSKVTVEGEIHNEFGLKVMGFNGFVYPKVFDKPVKYTTLGSDGGSFPQDFYVQDKELFSGKVSVIDGHFSFSFLVPKDISYQYGFGKISYYAVDTAILTDAKGAFLNLLLGGMNKNFVPDNQGPAISLYMDDRHFVTGGNTSPNPLLIADISDEQGINTTGNSLGRDIVFWIDDDKSTQLTVNSSFSLDVDSYQKGSLTYTLHNLSEGVHTLTLKAWDLQDNSSEKTIDFTVVKTGPLSLFQVENYPNPFGNKTWFSFKHNKPGQTLKVTIRIYTLGGRLVKEINKEIMGIGEGIAPIEWDGNNNQGVPVVSGFYLYRLRVTDEEGNTTVRTQKLMKINQ